MQTNTLNFLTETWQSQGCSFQGYTKGIALGLLQVKIYVSHWWILERLAERTKVSNWWFAFPLFSPPEQCWSDRICKTVEGEFCASKASNSKQDDLLKALLENDFLIYTCDWSSGTMNWCHWTRCLWRWCGSHRTTPSAEQLEQIVLLLDMAK